MQRNELLMMRDIVTPEDLILSARFISGSHKISVDDLEKAYKIATIYFYVSNYVLLSAIDLSRT